VGQEHVTDYITLSDCYDHFNEHLFGNELRGCVLTFEDRGQSFGYYRSDGFIAQDGKERRDEICLNPRHFLTNTGDLELLQTLVHEQVHQWQEQFGKPSLRTYHNREFAEKMLSVGLTPSSTGKPGGKMTGQKMADYPTPGGIFESIATELLEKKSLIRWYKAGVAIKHAQEYALNPEGKPQPVTGGLDEEEVKPPAKPPSKIGYQCPECEAKAWGKPGLSILCGVCRPKAGKYHSFLPVVSY
jgi:hypothetical protein